MKTNIAQRCKAYYKSQDFINNHAEFLMDDRSNCVNHIQRIIADYDLQKHYIDRDSPDIWNKKLHNQPPMELCELVYDYILEHIDDFIDTYCGYYGAPCCIDSRAFGEQEEQLFEVTNPDTGRPYGIKYMRKIFEQEGYYVADDRDYAYYDMSDDGVYVNLSKSKIELISNYYESLKCIETA